MLFVVYYIDVLMGNIKLVEVCNIMEVFVVKEVILLVYGDIYWGFCILGIIEGYIYKYDVKLCEGKIFSKMMEVIIGIDIVCKMGLKFGDFFLGMYGEVEGGYVYDEYNYKVVGILEKINFVLD